MGDVLTFRKPTLPDKAKNKTMCRNGFHKWKPAPETRFDVKAGKLVTLYRCARCDATRTEAT
jgi:hypothetical protein